MVVTSISIVVKLAISYTPLKFSTISTTRREHKINVSMMLGVPPITPGQDAAPLKAQPINRVNGKIILSNQNIT